MLLIEIERGWATDFKAARSNDIKLIKRKICVSIRDWNINAEKPIAQNLKVWPGCLAPFVVYLYIYSRFQIQPEEYFNAHFKQL